MKIRSVSLVSAKITVLLAQILLNHQQLSNLQINNNNKIMKHKLLSNNAKIQFN